VATPARTSSATAFSFEDSRGTVRFIRRFVGTNRAQRLPFQQTNEIHLDGNRLRVVETPRGTTVSRRSRKLPFVGTPVSTFGYHVSESRPSLTRVAFGVAGD
jgi:hypothetical protein